MVPMARERVLPLMPSVEGEGLEGGDGCYGGKG
jgi:hypothetical protein